MTRISLPLILTMMSLPVSVYAADPMQTTIDNDPPALGTPVIPAMDATTSPPSVAAPLLAGETAGATVGTVPQTPIAPPVFLSDTPPKPHSRYKFRIGFGFDFGANPAPLALGVVMHPGVDWVSVEAALTENVLSPGGRLSLRLDPFAAAFPRLPVGLFGDVQGGFAPRGNIPGHADLPSIGYDYLNLYGGLRFGRASAFNWVIEMGPSFLHATTDRFQSVLNSNGAPSGLTVANPVVNGMVSPTFLTGFQLVF